MYVFREKLGQRTQAQIEREQLRPGCVRRCPLSPEPAQGLAHHRGELTTDIHGLERRAAAFRDDRPAVQILARYEYGRLARVVLSYRRLVIHRFLRHLNRRPVQGTIPL